MLLNIASWNVNSIKVRLPQVLRFCKDNKVDIIALQETKSEDHNFPIKEIEKAGYKAIYTGEKQYNGVAILARYDFSDPEDELPGIKLNQKRYLAATIKGIRVINVYVPNGAEVDSPKYEYKLEWLKSLKKHISKEMKVHNHLIIMGDFNVAPEDKDVYDIKKWEGKILVSPKERKAFKSLLSLGLVDLYRTKHPEKIEYSWWDYRTFAFKRNLGLRIDHMLVSEPLLKECEKSYIDKVPRSWERPSDHTVIAAQFKVSK